MYKKFSASLLTLFHIATILPDCAPPPVFSNKLTTHFYSGQELNILSEKQFDPYCLFQYIFDSGITIDHAPIGKTSQTISIKADGRIKGLCGNKGSNIFLWAYS